MINDFPIKIREEVNSFLNNYEEVLNIENTYDYLKTAIKQGYTPDYLNTIVNNLVSDFTRIQKITSPYLPSKIKSPQIEDGIQDSVLTALSTLLRLINVIIIENPEQKDKLADLSKKYHEFIKIDRCRIYYRTDSHSCIYSDIDPRGVLQTWDEVFIAVCSDVDRIAGNIELLYELDKKYKFENKRDLRLDELIPCNLDLLDEKDRGKFLNTALHSDYFLDEKNLIDFNNIKLVWDFWGVEAVNIGREFDCNAFWDNAPENANFILSEENISLISPRLIQMALEIKYGQYA